MDFNARIDDLQERVTAVKTSVDAAAHETHEQLSQRIDEAHAEARSRAPPGTKQDASAANDRAEAFLGQGSSRCPGPACADLKAKAKRRADEVDADMAASDADWAEGDASAAIDYADWAVENARLAILDAIDARVTANEKAAALV
jgi:hypothetical protein